ncbi:MAG: hypothetical protein MK334_00230 [SAR202 cluster bacterium]|nr:hypothetical protein [SAR202 cluster bacterium]
MGSKILTGWMLVIGPILAVIMLFIEPGGTTEEASFSQTAQNLLESTTLGGITAIGWTIAALAITIGTVYLARSMQGEEKPGSDLAGLAAILALLSAGIVAVDHGLHGAVFDSGWTKQGGDAANALAIGEAIFRGMFTFMAASSLLLGIAIFLQKNLNQIAGIITAVMGALLLFGWILPFESEALDFVGFIGFLGWPIMTIVLGILTILSSKKDAK